MLQEDPTDRVREQRPEATSAEDAAGAGGDRDAADHRQSEEEAGGEDHLQADPQDQSGLEESQSELGLRFGNGRSSQEVIVVLSEDPFLRMPVPTRFSVSFL